MNAPIMPHRGVLVNCGNSLLARNLAAAYLVPGAALITLSVSPHGWPRLETQESQRPFLP